MVIVCIGLSEIVASIYSKRLKSVFRWRHGIDPCIFDWTNSRAIVWARRYYSLYREKGVKSVWDHLGIIFDSDWRQNLIRAIARFERYGMQRLLGTASFRV